jgi:hypothetical protein
MTDYADLIKYADSEQEKLLLALMSTNTMTEAGAKLGINPSNVTRRLSVLRQKAQRHAKTKVNYGRVHVMIPDCQVTPETPNDHLIWAGKYIADLKPDVIVNIGDFADMEALSSYDKGKRAAEGKRVIGDINAANYAMDLLMQPIHDEPNYNPELHFTMGNHEERIVTLTKNDPSLDGFLSLDALNYKEHGWTVHKFLSPVVIDGVSYCHYFANSGNGKPMGGENIMTRLKNLGYSFSMGHQQVYMQGERNLTNGRIIQGLVAGAFYMHDEDYRGEQGNTHWRGLVVKHEVCDGDYDVMKVSMNYLCKRFEGIPLHQFVKAKYPKIFDGSLFLQRQEFQSNRALSLE